MPCHLRWWLRQLRRTPELLNDHAALELRQSVFVLQKVLRGDREPLWPEQRGWMGRLLAALEEAREYVPWGKV